MSIDSLNKMAEQEHRLTTIISFLEKIKAACDKQLKKRKSPHALRFFGPDLESAIRLDTLPLLKIKLKEIKRKHKREIYKYYLELNKTQRLSKAVNRRSKDFDLNPFREE